MNHSRPLLILGTGPFALELTDLAAEVPGLTVAGYVENMELEKAGKQLGGLPVHWIDELAKFASTHTVACSLATPQRKVFVEQAASHGIPFATIVHPFSRVSPTAVLDEGVIVCPAVVVGAHTRIGRHVRLNRGALVGHHTEIDEYCTIQPGANIAGLCQLKDSIYVGMGAIVVDRIRIGSGSVVGAGSLVLKNVPDRVQVMGTPAQITKEIPPEP